MRLGYRPALDALRALAVAAVIVYHAYPDALPGGYIGVEVFFVLSGFLITRLLLDERRTTGTIDLRGFYGRRARRLLPAVAVLGAVYIVAGFVLDMPRIGLSLTAIGLYASNWVNAGGHPLAEGLSQMWSLAIEEQFYFVWPIALVGLLRRAPHRVGPILFTATVASLAWREVLWRAGASANRVYFGSDTRCSALLLGCLVAWVTVNGVPTWVRHLGAPALAALAWMAVWPPVWHHVSPATTLSVAALLSAVLIVAVLDRPGYGLAGFGRRAYGLYLWHPPVLAAAGLLPVFAGRTALALVGVVLVAEVSWRFVEQPILRYRRERRTAAAPIPPRHYETVTTT